MDYSAFSKRLKERDEPDAAYFFHGEEPYLMQRGIELITERHALEPAGRWTADETPWATISNALAGDFLFGPKRIVSVLYRHGIPPDHAAGLETLAKASTVFCARFWMEKAPGKAPEKTPEKLPKPVQTIRFWLKKSLAKLPKHVQTIQCDRPDSNMMVKWTRQEFGKRGQRIASDAVNAFTEGMMNRPLHACLNAIESISCYAGAGNAVESPHVDPFVTPDVQVTAFKICDALAGRRTADALAVLRDLMARDEAPLKILGAITWGFRKAWDAHERRRAGENRIEVARSLGVKYSADRIVQLAERLGARGLHRVFSTLLETDQALKGKAASKNAAVVMETAIHRLGLAAEG